MGSTKNVLKKFALLSAEDMSADIVSSAISCAFLDNLGIQIDWTGTPTGTFSVEASNDHEEDSQGVVMVAGTWVNVPLSASIAAAGSADDAYISLNQIPAPWTRIKYSASSGSGSLNVFVSGKGI